MIATGIMGEVRPGSATTGAAAGFDPYRDGSDDHLPEPNVSIDATGVTDHPAVYENPHRPVDGFRAILWSLTRNGIPRLPMGPSKVARMGQGMNRTGVAPQPINKVQQFQPVPSVAAAGEWYDYLR